MPVSVELGVLLHPADYPYGERQYSVEDFAGQHQGADQDGDEREPSDHGPLARLTLREHLGRLLDIASRVGVKLCGRSLGESPLAGRRSRARNP